MFSERDWGGGLVYFPATGVLKGVLVDMWVEDGGLTGLVCRAFGVEGEDLGLR